MTWITIFLTVCGAVFGITLNGLYGFVSGGLIGYLLGVLMDLRRRMSDLEQEQRVLWQQMVLPTREPRHEADVPPETPPEPFEPDAPPEKDDVILPPPLPGEMGPAQDEPLSPIEADFRFEEEAEAELSAEDRPPRIQPASARRDIPKFFHGFQEHLTTANIVLGLGVIVLFFGVAFLLKFAIDRGMLPLTYRYTGVGLFGLVLLVISWRLREKRRGYALILQGGAVGILYITVFSAARWHGLVPLPLAFGLMIALVLLSGLMAVWQDARGLAAYAAAGGFLAPVLTSTGGGHHVLLFSYYLLLSAGIFGVALFKTWRELNLIGFVFTLGVGIAWGVKYYQPDLFASTEPFLIIFFLLYLTVSILYALRQPPDLKGLVDGTLVFGLPLVAFGLQSALVRNMEYGLAMSALALSAVYIMMTAAIWRYRPEYLRLLAEAFLALGVVFGTLAIPLALEAKWTAASWALEGAALVWIGIRQGRILARCFGLLLQIGAGVAIWWVIDSPAGNRPVFNGVFSSFFLIGVSGLISAYYLKKFIINLHPWERQFHIVCLVWGLLWWYGGGLREIDLFVPYKYQLTAVLFFLTFSALLWGLVYQRLDFKTLLYPIFFLIFFLVLLFLAVIADFPSHPFRRLGYLAWPLALVMHYYLLWRFETGLARTFRRWQHLLSLWLTIFLLTWEMAWLVDRLVGGAGTWRFMAWGIVPAVCARMLMKWGLKIKWPAAAYREDYLVWGTTFIVFLAWLWLVIGSLTKAGDPWPLKYVVIVNPLELAQLFVLEAIIAFYLRIRDHRIIIAPDWPLAKYLLLALCATVFILASSFLARSVHYWAGVPWDIDALWSSMVFQACLSIYWTVLSLSIMVAATRKSWRKVWFAGALLLGLVAFKLFLVDLSRTGTIARIVSFLVVGVLMLLIGYFSPVPPRSSQEAAK